MPENRSTLTHPHWYSPKTGIYYSKHATLELPTDPFLDIISFIFSHRHNGVSALVDSSSGCSISYPKLFPFVESMASGLHKMGVSQGDVVLLLIPNSIYYPIVFLGVLYVGAIVAPLNPLSSVSEIHKQITDCGVSLVFAVPENVKKLQPFGIPIIAVPENGKCLKQGCFSNFCNLISGKLDLLPRPLIQQDDTAAILYSSGTTGVSKGVVLTHKNFISMVELFVRFEASQYEYSSFKNVFLAVLPMFHVYGLSLFAMGLLSLGSTVIVMRKFDINEVIMAIDKYKVTHFPVVPPMLTALTKRAKGVNLRLLAPNMEAKVVGWNSGAVLPPGSSGELWLRGPSIMRGYLNNEEATMSTIDKDGWLHTGDVVYFDQDGYLHISDRLKDIIKYKGFQIAPADLEAVLISHPEVVDVAVAAAMDEETGEIPVAFVVRKVGSTLSPKLIMDYVAKQVAPCKKVRKVVFTDSIPRSATGKILRRQLRNCLTSKL